MEELKRVVRIAKNVRKWTEKLHQENPIKCASPALEGYCAIASYELFKRLNRAKIQSQIAGNDYHVFVIYDNHIVDITATQFSMDDKIMVRRLVENEQEPWNIKILMWTKKDAVTFFRDWPYLEKHPDLQERQLELAL